jgi:hypothetical protein
MPGINIEALNTGDLRRLLKVAHDRHDGPLADQLEWEIAARATSAARSASPFATLPEDEPDEPGFRMDATDDAPVDPEPRTAARRVVPEAGTLEVIAPEPRPEAPAPDARRMTPAQAEPADGSQWLSMGLAALAGCLVTAAIVFAAERMGERAAMKRLLPAQEAAITPGAPALPLAGWPAPAPSLAPLQQAFGGTATPPVVGARPGTVAHAPKKPPRRPPARASERDLEAADAATRAQPSSLEAWSKQEEPIY